MIHIPNRYGDVPTPVEDTDAANKKYVDTKIKSGTSLPDATSADAPEFFVLY